MGSSVAIQRTSAEVDGYLALGAPGRSVNGTPGGGAFIHVRAVGQNAYAFEALVQHPEAEAGDRFGSAVGIDGTRLAVGADGRARGPSFPDQGRVYVFDRQAPSGGAWPLRQELTFPGSGNVNLGRALSVALDMIVVGWPAQDFAASGGGAAIYACDLLFVDGLQGNTAARPCTRP
nr:FG-GAP repeat protein [Tahibacter harae]